MKYFSAFCISLSLFFTVRAQHQATFYSSDSFRLEGTLTVPDGVGKHPVLLLVHGSGPVDRNSTLHITNQPNYPCIYPNLIGQTSTFFKDAADSLREAGIAVLRYDKRTTRPGEIDQEALTVNHFVSDIKAGINYLKTRPEIDTHRIFLSGHSQGSNLTARLAAERTDLRGVISAAGSSSRIDSLIADQVFRIQDFCNNDSAAGDAQRMQVLQTMAAVMNGSIPDNQIVMGAYPPFWRSWINLSDSVIDLYKATRSPLLFLQGTDDFNVPENESVPFQNLENDSVTVHILEGINHLFNDGNNVETDRNTLTIIIDWILDRSKDTPSQISENFNGNNFYTLRHSRGIAIAENLRNISLNVTLYDLNGRLITSKTVAPKSTEELRLNRGINLIRLQNADQTDTMKVVY